MKLPEWWPYDKPYAIMDCMEAFDQIPRHSIKTIIADPPYSFGLGSSSKPGKVNPWGDIMNGSYFYRELVEKSFNVLQGRGSLWIFNSWRSLPTLMKGVFDAGHKIESLLIWDKEVIGAGGVIGLRPSYEVVALIPNEKFRFKDRGKPDIWRCMWTSNKPNHPAEKPVKLIEEIIVNSSDEGDVIFDPFLGSGTTIISSINKGRIGLGTESDPNMEGTIRRRILQDVSKLEEFF